MSLDQDQGHSQPPANGVRVEAMEPMPFAWQQWAAARIARSMPIEQVIDDLVGYGFERGRAHMMCIELLGSPFFDTARSTFDRLAKLESVLTVRQQLRDLSTAGSEVEERSGVTGDEFLHDYYSANLPLVLTDVATDWPAIERWNPGYLGTVLGDERVEVMADRDADRRFEINSDRHRSTLPFSEYVAYVESAVDSNDVYLVANNHLLERTGAEPLWDDFTIDSRYLDGSRTRGLVFLWFGPRGTVTPLHHDVVNVLFVQVRGRKRFRLVSPLDSHCVYNEVGVYSEVDPVKPDLSNHPRFSTTRTFDIILNAGQALFVPAGWWHHVVALDVSISLSFTNFHWPNTFTWHHPNVQAK